MGKGRNKRGVALDNCDKPYRKTVGGPATNPHCLYGSVDARRKADLSVRLSCGRSPTCYRPI